MRVLISQSKREGDGWLSAYSHMADWWQSGTDGTLSIQCRPPDKLPWHLLSHVLKLHAHGPSCSRQGALFTLGISRKTDPKVEKTLQTSVRVIGEERINPISEC